MWSQEIYIHKLIHQCLSYQNQGQDASNEIIKK